MSLTLCYSLSDEQLYCRSVWSSLSGSTRAAIATALCNSNEEMFSCSSYSKNGKRRGEHIEVKESGEYLSVFCFACKQLHLIGWDTEVHRFPLWLTAVLSK